MPKSAQRHGPTLGRAQGARPPATSDTPRQAEGPRALPEALLLPIEQISPDPNQPRKAFVPERLGELAASIAAEGILQPLLVREEGHLDDGRTRYVIIAGGRRYAAAQQAGLTRLPVLVRDSSGARLRIQQLLENIQREALAPVDEARAFKELMDLENMSLRDLAGRLHRSHGYIAERLLLVEHPEVASAVTTGRVNSSAAAVVAREQDTTVRRELLRRAESDRLGRRDVQLLRRELRMPPAAPPPTPVELTLREVAEEMGATEAHIRAAAQARRDEPDLSAAEALTLVMSTEPARDTAQPAPSEVEALLQELDDASATATVIRLLAWAEREKLDIAGLRDVIAEREAAAVSAVEVGP